MPKVKKVSADLKKDLKKELKESKPDVKPVAKPAPAPAVKPPAPPASLLTDAQKKISRDMFAKYDLAKLTADQAKIILKVLETAGIHGSAVLEAAKESGLDAQKFWALTNPGQPLPPQPK